MLNLISYGLVPCTVGSPLFSSSYPAGRVQFASTSGGGNCGLLSKQPYEFAKAVHIPDRVIHCARAKKSAAVDEIVSVRIYTGRVGK